MTYQDFSECLLTFIRQSYPCTLILFPNNNSVATLESASMLHVIGCLGGKYQKQDFLTVQALGRVNVRNRHLPMAFQPYLNYSVRVPAIGPCGSNYGCCSPGEWIFSSNRVFPDSL
jgi:hypothetical protein